MLSIQNSDTNSMITSYTIPEKKQNEVKNIDIRLLIFLGHVVISFFLSHLFFRI